MQNILVATRCPITRGCEERWEKLWKNGWGIMHGAAHRGALYGRLVNRVDNPQIYYTWGEWESPEVFDAITKADDIESHRQQMGQMLSEPITRHWYELVGIGGARDSSNRRPAVVTLDIYVYPGKEHLWEELWSDLWRDIKPNKGWIAGRLARDINDPQHYLNLGEWESEQAWGDVVSIREMSAGLEFMNKKVFAKPAVREWWKVVGGG